MIEVFICNAGGQSRRVQPDIQIRAVQNEDIGDIV